ncbi:ParA family protein [Paraburkholderia sp. J8-2]|uniref:ParA family protein n=1 Tax=Paraburkholderia sp. J8-2 TaxID=2805440 RepID=UPI002AB73FDA|nr:ParA family protein [Paraburkholderia sp. J8-2]
MPIVVLMSPKGGVGKTTSSLTLAASIAHRALHVSLIDADPNHPLTKWHSIGNAPTEYLTVTQADEESIIDVIEERSASSAFTIVDLEGTAGKIALLAASQADLVIIPMQGSTLDADQASRALRVIRQQEKMMRRTVPHSILFTRTNPAIKTRTYTALATELRELGVAMFETELMEREAYKAQFSFGSTIYQLVASDVSGLERARQNADALYTEVLTTLKRAEATQ